MKKTFIIIGILFIAIYMILLFQQLGNNRYQIIMHPTFRADQYLLDSKTGNVWHLVEDKDKLLLWEPMLKSNPTIEELTKELNK